jgi:hypothetical protein
MLITFSKATIYYSVNCTVDGIAFYSPIPGEILRPAVHKCLFKIEREYVFSALGLMKINDK